VALALLLVVGAERGVAQELRVAYIDSERIFQAFQDTQEAQQQFDRELQTWTKDAAEKKREIDEMRTQIESQSRMLSQEKLDEKQAELAKKIADYEDFVQSIWGPNGKVAQRNTQLTEPIVRKVREVVERIAREQNYTLIFDVANGNIIYGARALDITNDVITELQKQKTP
jgi:outer membrane protein